MPGDNFNSNAIEGPGRHHYAITPDDAVDEADYFRGVYVGVTGDVDIVDIDGVSQVYKNAQQGSTIPMQGKRVNDTLTTATNLVGMW